MLRICRNLQNLRREFDSRKIGCHPSSSVGGTPGTSTANETQDASNHSSMVNERFRGYASTLFSSSWTPYLHRHFLISSFSSCTTSLSNCGPHFHLVLGILPLVSAPSPNQKSSLRFFFNSKVNKKASSGQNKACELTIFLHQFTAFANLRTVYHFLSWYLGDYVKPFVSILLFELLFYFASVFTNNTQQLTSFTLILTLPFHLVVKYNWHASIAYMHVNNY